MEQRETVCAVVVTYNRKDLLIECLEALRNQTRPVDAIYLIDNASTDNTPKLLLEKGYIDKLPPQELTEQWEQELKIDNVSLHYVRMNENTGGAGGFHEGVKLAYERGYDLIWVMDDDAMPLRDALQELVKYENITDNVLALASRVVMKNGDIDIFHRGYMRKFSLFPTIQKPVVATKYNNPFVKIDTASFVGLILSRKAISCVGLPRKEFFIHHDDVDYTLKISNKGLLLLVPSSIVLHKENAHIKKLKKPYESLWISYYGVRNHVYLANQIKKNTLIFWCGLTISFLKKIMKIVLVDDHKYKRCKFYFNAYIDGLKGEFDNSKPREILYE